MTVAGKCILLDGTIAYYNADGRLHREDGPAIEYNNINHTTGECWYFNGKKHRIGGPAITRLNGIKEWWEDGLRHRIDGPAIKDITDDVRSYDQYYFRGTKVECNSLEEFLKLIKLKAFW